MLPCVGVRELTERKSKLLTGRTRLVSISSCDRTGKSLYQSELAKFARLGCKPAVEIVESHEEAEVILIVDISEENQFECLRRNPVWKEWPEKSFGLYEGDHPPRFLHGLYSSVTRSWCRTGRFASCAYPMHQACFSSLRPDWHATRDREKDLLFSFVGRNSHKVRRRIIDQGFRGLNVLVDDTSQYNHFDTNGENRQAYQSRFWDIVGRSKYVLCPRGSGPSSMRLFEVMEAGVAPVIISDQWVPPIGPCWEEFAIFVQEKHVSRLHAIVEAHETEYIDRGLRAREAYKKYFAPENYWQFLLNSIALLRKCQWISERYYVSMLPWFTGEQRVRDRMIRWGMQAKHVIRSGGKAISKRFKSAGATGET
jgi:hypothetical protein